MLQLPAYINTLFFSEKILTEKSSIPLQLIFAIAFYIPFEDLFITWLPLPDIGTVVIRVLPELIIYTLLIRVIYLHFTLRIPLKKTPIDPLLLAFLLCCIVSVLANQASLFRSIDYIRLTWRYVSIYYIIVNINIPIEKIRSFLNILKKLGIFQGILTSLQFFIPAEIKVAFAKGGCEKALVKGASCGSFTDSATLAGFLLITITLLIAHLSETKQPNTHWLRNIIFVAVSYFGLFASKKRAALVVILFVPALLFFLLKRRKMSRTYIWLVISLGTLILFIVPILTANFNLITQESSSVTQTDISSYFLRIFSAEYWENFFLNARGWFIAIIGHTLIKSGSIFGFSPDIITALENMSSYIGKAIDVAKLERDQAVFYDAYWFAQLAFYGFTGLVIYWMILVRLYRTSESLIKTKILEYRYLGAIFCAVILISFLYSFVERLFMLRTFSFYFWMFAGFIINVQHSIKIKGKYTNMQIVS